MPVLAAKSLRVKGEVLRAKELSIARTHAQNNKAVFCHWSRFDVQQPRMRCKVPRAQGRVYPRPLHASAGRCSQ